MAFAQRCFGSTNVHNHAQPSATFRSVTAVRQAKQCLWAVPKKRLSHDVHDVDLFVNSIVTYVAFCDMRRGSVCILPGIGAKL